jgi:hypothetical protein
MAVDPPVMTAVDENLIRFTRNHVASILVVLIHPLDCGNQRAHLRSAPIYLQNMPPLSRRFGRQWLADVNSFVDGRAMGCNSNSGFKG